MSLHRVHSRVVSVVVCCSVVFLAAAMPVRAGRLTYTLRTSASDVSLHATSEGVDLSLAGGRVASTLDAGRAAVPYRIVNVVIPQGEMFGAVSVVASPVQTIANGVRPLLVPDLNGDSVGASVPHATTDAATSMGHGNESSAYPVKAAEYLGSGTLHGYVVASFAVYPVGVDGATVFIRPEITIDVATRLATGEPPLSMLRDRPEQAARFRDRVASLVVNSSELSAYRFARIHAERGHGGFEATTFPSLEGSPVDYVIVTNDSLAAAYQQLADWKTAKGVPTVVRTTEWIEANYRQGSDMQETIRNFVKDAYAKWGISYLLLGGDAEQIPARLGSSFYVGEKEVPVDMYFGCLDGDWNGDHDADFGEKVSVDGTDLYAEVIVGRLPTSSVAEVSAITDKVVGYETPTSRRFATKVLMLAEVLFPVDWMEPDPVGMNGAMFSENVYNASLTNPQLEVTRLYETEYLYPGAIHEDLQTTLDSLNSGFNFVNHVGHGFRFNMSVGNGSVLNSDADAMTNSPYYGNYYLLNCTALAYTYSCLGEHLLRSVAGGAVSVIGANESAFPYVSSVYMDAYYDQLFSRNVSHIGQAFARSRETRTPIAMVSDNSDLWTHYIYTLLGDPEMPLWTGVVDTLQVSHASSVGLGTTPITVTVLTGGTPVDSALVCLSKGTDDYQVGTTNGAGQVTLNFRSESAGAIRVVATGRNHARYEGTIGVVASGGAYVSVATMVVDDDSVGGSSGNGDGVIDAGETVDLTVSVTNSGDAASASVDLVLRSADAGVTIPDSLAAVGVVVAGSTRTATDAVRVVLGSGLGDGASVGFTVVVKENGTAQWSDAFKREIHAPKLTGIGLRIDDSAVGNGDGIQQVGEVVDVYYEVKNYGSGAAYGLTSQVRALGGGYFTMVDSTSGYADLGVVTSGENVTGYRMSESGVTAPHYFELTLGDAYGRTIVDTLELRLPDAPTNLVFDPSLGADRLSIEWTASVAADVGCYNVYQSEDQGGPYGRVNVDPVEHAVFLSTGLNASSKYYFVVTAVDSSGNESAYSTEGSGSTNPAQMAGWPIQMNVETTSSPVVGDLDGDGSLEIVVGDDQVWAWHGQGGELVDGDGNAQTWGLLNTTGSSYVSPIALADVDGLPGNEILAASRDTREVYAFDYTGATAPGWPQSVETTIRAAMTAGDMDGDGVIEVVAVDERGTIYVWHADGTELIDGDLNPSTPGVFRRLPLCYFHYSSPAMADFDGDGRDELAIGAENDSLYVIDDDGTNMPGWPRYLGADMSGSAAVGDIDGDGDYEIVANTLGGSVLAVHHDATTLWSTWVNNGISLGPSPALGDLDGDGKLETLIPSSDKQLYLIRSNGGTLPGWPVTYTDNLYTESSPVIADVDGDGAPDVILGGETRFVYAWDVTGGLVAGFPVTTGDAMRATPVVADVDLDGDVDLLAAGWDKSVYIWDFPSVFNPTNAPWNSFQGNMNNSGLHGDRVLTGIGDVAFSFDVRAGRVDLAWSMPYQQGSVFDIDRVELSAGSMDGAPDGARDSRLPAGGWQTIGASVAVDVDGTLRLTDGGVEAGTRYSYRVRRSGAEGVDVVITSMVYVPVSTAKLDQNYPNPFNPATRIVYYVPDGRPSRVRLTIYDVEGRRVRTLVDGVHGGGRFSVEWDGRGAAGGRVASGVYFYRLIQPGFSETRKMLLLK